MVRDFISGLNCWADLEKGLSELGPEKTVEGRAVGELG